MKPSRKPAPLLGAHMSTAGGVDRALERGASIGCDCVQLFLKNNMQWSGPPLKPDEITRFHKLRLPAFAHSGYLLNLASPKEDNRRRSIAALVDEIERATALGVPFIVMHPGAHMGAGEEAGLRTLVASLDEVFATTRKSKVQIALETTAGQGTCLGHRFEHLAAACQSSKHPRRLAVCVDTCHIFAAGYDIRTPAGYKAVMTELDKVIGHEQVVAFHLNDSKKPLGSRVDRHEHIGKGHIGLPAFRCVMRDSRWAGLLMSLETPKSEDLHEDVENLRLLRSLR
jgi:deoxyribonuclease-4